MGVTIKDWARVISPARVKLSEPLSRYTTMGVGGAADWLVCPNSVAELRRVINFVCANGLNYFVLGGGSNVLFSDAGFRGVVISTENLIGHARVSGTKLTILAGERLSRVLQIATNNNLSGLEWAVGIPARIGGATACNAGAFGHSLADVVAAVWVLRENEIVKLKPSECGFSYHSAGLNTGDVVVKVEFNLERKSKPEIIGQMKEFFERRDKTQPKEPSSGCIFKRTENFPAGFLIDQAGLKGLSVGGARVSEIHANFIVNTGGATCADILKLIEIIRDEVKLKFGLKLTLEVLIKGETDDNNGRLSHPYNLQQI